MPIGPGRVFSAAVALVGVTSLLACGSTAPPSMTPPPSTMDASAADASMTDATMKIVVSVSCDDAPASTYADPGSSLASASDHGSILRCAHDGALAATDIDRLARSAGYLGATLVSGAEIVRVLYRTERGTEPPASGFASAVVL